MKKKLVTAVLATTLLLTMVVPAQASPLLGEDSYVTLEDVTESTEEDPPDPTETSSQEKEIERKYSPDYDISPYYNDTEEEVEEVETVTRSANIGFNNDATADADPNLQTIYNKVGNASVKTYNSYTYNAWMGTKDCTWRVNTDGVKNTASNTHKKAAEEIAKDSSYKSKWVRSDVESFWEGSGAATPKKYTSIKNSSSIKVTDKNIEKAFLVWTTRSSKNGSLPIIFVNSDNEAYSINADNYPETPKLGSKKALVDNRVVRQDNWSEDDLNKAQPNKIFYTSYADVTDYMSGDGTYSVCNLPIYWSDYYDNSDTQRAATCGSSATDMANVNGGENLSSWSLFIVSETSDSRPHVVTIKVGSQYVLTGGSRELLTVQTKTDFGEFKTQTSSATPVAINTAFTTSGTGSNGDLLARVNFAKGGKKANKVENPKDKPEFWYDPTDYALNASGGGIYGSNGNVPTDKAKGSSVSCFSVQAKDTSVWNTLRYVVTDVALEKVDIDATQTITVKERSKPVAVSGKFTNTTTNGKTGFSYGKLVVTLPKGLTVSDSNSSPVLTAHKWERGEDKTKTLKGTVSTKNGQQQIVWEDKNSTEETAQVLRSVTGSSAPSEKGKRDYFEYSIDCDFNAKKGVETFRATEVLYGVKESNGSKPYGKSSFQLQSGNAKEVPKYILTVKTEGPAVSIGDGAAQTTTVTKELKPAAGTTGRLTMVKATGNFKDWTISDSDINKIVEYGENHDTTIDSDRFKASSSLNFYMPNKDITLTATALPYKIYYHANGGTAKGWQTSQPSKSSCNRNGHYASKVNFYELEGAKQYVVERAWKEHKSGCYIFSKDDSGNNKLTKVISSIKNSDTALNLINVPTMLQRSDGYNATGSWRVGSADSSTKVSYSALSGEAAVSAINTLINNANDRMEIHLYADWKPKTVNVKFDYGKNGGYEAETGTASKIQHNIPVGANVLSYAEDGEKNGDTGIYSKSNSDGWQFVGWNTDPEATTGLTSLKAELSWRDHKNHSDTDTSDACMTLYAIYKKHVKATFISHEYTGTDEKNIPASVKKKVTIEKDIFNNNTTLSFTFPDASGINMWTFDGWISEDTADVAYSGGYYNKSNTIAKDTTGSTICDVTYYAQYHKVISWYFVQQKSVDRMQDTIYRNSYDINKYKASVDCRAPKQILKAGWNATGWTTNADCHAASQTDTVGMLVSTEGAVYYGLYQKDVTVTYDTNTYDPVNGVPDPQTGKAYFSTASWDFSQVKDYVHPSYKNVLSNSWLNEFFQNGIGYSKPVDLRKTTDQGFEYPTITVANTVPVYRKINQRETDVLPTIWSTNPKGFTVDFEVTQGEWPEGFDRRINCNPQTSYEFREDTTLYQQYETLKMPADKKIHTSVSILVGDSINVGNRFKSDYFSDLGRVYVSPDHSIATVTEAGKITGRGPGVITIKVYTSDGKTDIGDCKVIVSSSSVKIPDRITLGEQAEVGITARSGEGASVTATLSMDAVSALRGRESSKLYSLHSYFGNGNDFTEVDAGNTILKAASSNGKPATDTKTFYVMPDISLQSLKSDVYDATIVWKLHLTLN